MLTSVPVIKCFWYLRDDGFMLQHAVVFLLDADVVQQWQRERLAVAAQHRLTLAHISGGEGEAAGGVGGVVPDVTERRRAAQLLPCGAQLPVQHRANGQNYSVRLLSD